jgi:ABC-type lipoprotein release transport system permease subunit
MMIYIKLSWRNVWRNKKRSFVVISSISLGVFFMLISMAFVNGMNYQMIDNTISTSLGHVSIHKKGFHDNMKVSYSFNAGTDITGGLNVAKGVAGWAPRVQIQGIIRSSEASQGVVITGIDPDKEKNVSEIFNYLIKNGESEYLDNPAAGDVLISEHWLRN